jgi:hypothetical protein
MIYFATSCRKHSLGLRRSAALDRIKRKNPKISAREAYQRASQAAGR